MEPTEAKYDAKVVKNVLIPMRDGVQLACDVYMPDTAGKFPAVLTIYPYHKDGLIGKVIVTEELRAFAPRGYVYVLLDMRGTGNSEGQSGFMRFQQWEDGYDAVEWIAQQPWCNGNVGMCGWSYGGFTSINVASLNPPHLKAIVPVMAQMTTSALTHPGGALRCLGLNLWYGMQLCMDVMPPFYTDEEARWLKVWNSHLEHYKEYLSPFYEHPTEDDFMREGAALFRLDNMKAASYFIFGFRDIDSFPDGPLAYYNEIKCPKKLLVGPWKHGLPDSMVPGPNVDYLNEMVRWFDYWLKGIDTGIMNEPPITIRVQGPESKWRYENEWPVVRRKETTFYLHPEAVLDSKLCEDKDESDSFEHNATVGVCRGLEDEWAFAFGLPMDQRDDEALSLTYTTQPLPEDTEIAGAPVAKLFVSTSADEGVISVKLNDVAPDGSSTLITSSVLNLSKRESREAILAVKPGELYEIVMKLWDTSYLVKAGHRLRVAIASSDFPYIWPTPKTATNTVYHSQKYPSQIVIPFVPERTPSLPPPNLREVIPPMQLPAAIEYSKPYWRIERDLIASTITVCNGTEEKIVVSPTTTMEMVTHVRAVASAIDPADAKVTSETIANIEGHKLGIVNIRSKLVTTHKTSHLAINITVDDLLIFSKRWSMP